MNILFVCTANICRSFMAERIIKKKLDEDGRSDIHVSSAGLLDMGGTGADPVAAAVLEAGGYDADGHRSRQLTGEIVAGADKIMVMERRHKDYIETLFEDVGDKVYLLKPFSQGCEQLYINDTLDINDPHGLSVYSYRLCFAEVSLAIEGLLTCL